jgi:hypothetical protein
MKYRTAVATEATICFVCYCEKFIKNVTLYANYVSLTVSMLK